ncbi:MAG: hypothetical protein LBL67_03270 [Coriobacteriales bacterium]|jgi:anaerobic dimethyl sulfoxide reductase subunit B (iron-sulfur subunit)|nr:hypothetical protein [Coriobacteriales bacterium]
MSAKGLLIDYQWCTGCHSCEVACQMEHGLPPDQHGIVVNQVGPWQLPDGSWQFDNIPSPTRQCDLCAARTAKAELPTCVHHCQAKCMRYGDLEELAANLATSPHQVLFSL